MTNDNWIAKAVKQNENLVTTYTPVLIHMLIKTFWYTNIFQAGSDIDRLLSEARCITFDPLRHIPSDQLYRMQCEIACCCVEDFADHKKTPTEGQYLPVTIRQIYGDQGLEPYKTKKPRYRKDKAAVTTTR